MIEFNNVTFVHQSGIKALDRINLKISKGELVAIVGENGAGKTTLVKHMVGLLKPTSGTVSVFGEDTRKKSVAELSRKVGIVFQNPDHQLFSQTVEDEVAFALRNFNFPEELIMKRVDWALNFFGLEQYRKNAPVTLSGGEKKRLTLACILAWDPEVIVLDEPTVGQDAIQKEKLNQVIRMLNSTGKTIVIVSHDIEFLWPLRPRYVLMSGGRILLDGTSDVFLNDELIRKARITKPQLLKFYLALKIKPDNFFYDVFDAKNFIKEVIAKRTG